MTKLRSGLLALLLALAVVWVGVMPAAAEDAAPITRYDVDVDLSTDGVASVNIDFTVVEQHRAGIRRHRTRDLQSGSAAD